jgi:hypothetical protein
MCAKCRPENVLLVDLTVVPDPPKESVVHTVSDDDIPF